MELAIDFGGTNIKMAAFEKGREECLWRDSIPSFSDAGIEQALERVSAHVKKNCPGKAEIVGIATPGIVDVRQARLLWINGKFKDAEGFSFGEWCRSSFDCPLVMENDANAALLGEASYGCAAGKENVVMMILGTGIGTAAMMDGKLLYGSHYRAGIMGGHFLVQLHGRACNCGAKGCLEAYAGAGEFVSSVKQEDGFSKSALAQTDELTMKSVFLAGERGDAFALKQIDRLIGYYAAGLINMVYAYDSECVVLSGGIAKGALMLADRLEEIINAQPWIRGYRIPVLVSADPDFSVTRGLRRRMEDYYG